MNIIIKLFKAKINQIYKKKIYNNKKLISIKKVEPRDKKQKKIKMIT
jgi:cupin superfamily acireductone dioxygenase involved in methionine salvage